MKIKRGNKELEIKTILDDGEDATIFHHFKGKEYKIVSIGYDADNMDKVVIYQALYDDHKVWVREYNDFFSKTDKKKYPDIKQEYRFEIKE